MRDPTVVHLFCGAGGGGLGFARAGFRCLAAIDNEPAACRDYTRLVGSPATCADLETMSVDELRALTGGESPDVVFTSPPCKGFASCMGEARASTEKYQRLNRLTLRGIWLTLEAWDRPPRLVLLENVPRIQTRGAWLLEQIEGLLHAKGYAVARSVHDCGELGGLAQHRRRFLLAARHMESVPAFLRVPQSKRVRAIGEVLGELPVPLPGSSEGGPLHTLPKLAPINWVRLALIPAGGDWRDLPPEVHLVHRDARQNGGLGVEGWDDPSHAVVAEGTVRNTRASVADPRLGCTPTHAGHLGVEGWDDASRTVRADHRVQNAPAAIADPRVTTDRYPNALGVADFNAPALTVRGMGRVQTEQVSVADPRVGCRRRDGGHGVRAWSQPSCNIIASASIDNFPAQVADPRMGCEPRSGTMGVVDWASPSHTVRGHHNTGNSPAAVADPRVPEIEGPAIDIDSKRPTWIVIRAADGTWHRPMTTLELAALQGFPTRLDGEWLVLGDGVHRVARELIGNAVPPPAAEAIAINCKATLTAAADGFALSSESIWVHEGQELAT